MEFCHIAHNPPYPYNDKVMKYLWSLVFILFIPGIARANECAPCPVCDCVCRPPSRDNYAGVRLYINKHTSYDYHDDNLGKLERTMNNLGFGTTMGNNLNDWIRVEYETLYMGTQYSQRDIDFEYDIWANFLNAYALWNCIDIVTPYAGAGLGLTGIWGELDGHLNNAFDLSYQVMAGILIHINPRIDLDLGAKYVNYGTVDQSHGHTHVDATQIYLGAVYRFGL